MSKNFGYTLAEVLISIVVIGVIAAVCTPMIMNTIPNKNAMMIKKAYYTVDNVVKLLINDSYYYPDMKANCITIDSNGNSQYNGSSGINNCYYGFDYVDNITSTLSVKSSSGSINASKKADKFTYLFASYLDTKKQFSELVNANNNSTDTTFKFLETTDGMVYNISGLKNSGSTPPFYIYIDVNGKEGPNAFAPSYSAEGSKNKCASYNDWTPTKVGSNFDNRRFDRIKIQIDADGSIKIPNTQTEFINIISKANSEFNKDNSD